MMEKDRSMTDRTEGTGSLPEWDRLPDIELYMDQVLLLADRCLRGAPGYDRRGLTASMVNNYVKQGVLPPPVKKKYGRNHLACLLMICSLKQALPISAIRTLLERQRSVRTPEQIYTQFCRIYAETRNAVTPGTEMIRDDDGSGADAVCYAALRACAEQALAVRMFRELFETVPGEEQTGEQND